MNILFFTAPASDYLADSMLHGLRGLFGPTVVDYPRCDLMYANHPGLSARAHGRGFTLYGLLDDHGIDRYDVLAKLKAGFYELVVISSIHRQFGWFLQMQPWLKRTNTIILDGEDGPEPFPYSGTYWRRRSHRHLPRVHGRYLYFKRELMPETLSYRWFTLLPGWLAEPLSGPRNFRKVAFSIPAEKLTPSNPEKTKEFPRHIVDAEIAARVPDASSGHAFDSEAAYYEDLQASRWGITTKRSGWDCLRHYEIAANAAVICFRSLGSKPHTCAPHDLTSSNSISYDDWDHLRSQIDSVSTDRYADLQAAAMSWARANTTMERARQVVDEWRRSCR